MKLRCATASGWGPLVSWLGAATPSETIGVDSRRPVGSGTWTRWVTTPTLPVAFSRADARTWCRPAGSSNSTRTVSHWGALPAAAGRGSPSTDRLWIQPSPPSRAFVSTRSSRCATRRPWRSSAVRAAKSTSTAASTRVFPPATGSRV